MKIYIQREGHSIVPISLRDVLAEAIKKNVSSNVEVNVDSFCGREESSWVEVKETREDKVISLNLMFDEKGDSLTDINLFETPIIKVVDEDNQKKLI